MTTKAKQIIGEYKYLLAGLIALAIFFSVRSCVNTQSDFLQGRISALQNEREKLQDGAKVAETERLRLKDLIRLEDIKAKEKLKNLEEQKLASEDRVKFLEQEAKKSKSEIKNMNLVEVANTLNEVYGGNNAVATSNSVDTKGSLPYQILETVVDANSAQDIIKEKDKQLVNRDSVISVKDTQIKSSTLNLFSAEKSLKASQDLNRLQTELNNSLEKENRRVKRKNTFNKILIPVAGAIGIWSGYKLAGNK